MQNDPCGQNSPKTYLGVKGIWKTVKRRDNRGSTLLTCRSCGPLMSLSDHHDEFDRVHYHRDHHYRRHSDHQHRDQYQEHARHHFWSDWQKIYLCFCLTDSVECLEKPLQADGFRTSDPFEKIYLLKATDFLSIFVSYPVTAFQKLTCSTQRLSDLSVIGYNKIKEILWEFCCKGHHFGLKIFQNLERFNQFWIYIFFHSRQRN